MSLFGDEEKKGGGRKKRRLSKQGEGAKGAIPKKILLIT